jgi:HAE1 family hydrophobic/amphiphilic exporter-1
MDIAKLSVDRPVATWMRILVFVLLGAIAFTQLPVELLPDVAPPSMFVSTSWSGVSPEDLESQITLPVEDVLATVPGVMNLSSQTSEGSSRVTVEFPPGYDLGQASLDILQQVQRAQRSFPTDDASLQAPTVQKFDPNSMPILVLGVSGISDPVRLRSVLQDDIKPILESAQGVGAANVNGGQERAIMVEFDTRSLLAHSVSAEDIVSALRSENRNVPAGTAYEGNRQLLVRSYGWLQNVDQLRYIPVGSPNGNVVPLQSVARISDSHRDISNIQRLNGQPAASLEIQKQAGANTVTTVEEALAKLENVKQRYPELEFVEVYNQARYVNQAVHSLEEAAVLGGSLAMLVVFFFLRNFRSTLVVATSIPVSVISTFAFMWWFDYSLNTMSLVGLALATGLIVDDAVVVMENIYRKMEHEGLPPREAALEGTRPIISAVVSSTLTIMVVFFPLLLIPGQTGQMFKQFALVVIVSLAFSLLDALTGVPMLCSQFIRVEKPKAPEEQGFWGRTFITWGRWFDNLDAAYGSILGRAMKHPWKVLASGAALTAVSFVLVPFIGYDFMPGTDTGVLRLSMNMPKGTSLEETDRAMLKLEAIMAAHPDVQAYLTSVGSGSGSRGSRDSGSAYIVLRNDRRRPSADQISAQLGRQFSEVPAVRAFPSTMDIVSRLIGGGNQGEGFEINIYGPDLETLNDLAGQFVERIRTVEGAQDIRNRAGDPSPEIRWIIDRAKATKLGVSFSQVASAIQTASEGVIASYLQTGGRRAPIVVQLEAQERRGTSQLRSLIVNTSLPTTTARAGSGTTTASPGRPGATAEGIQLWQVAEARTALGYPTIYREARQRYGAVVSAGQGRPISELQADVSAVLADLELPDGYRWDWSERMKRQQGEFQKLAFAGALAVVLIYMLLCIQFENLVVPLSILLCVPLCILGVILSLFLAAIPFSVMAGVGCLLLIGIAVKNGILLIENTLQARERGMSREEALLFACPERLRPILMTAFAAILGMIPIALRGELEAPMAVAVIGGLFASTMLTLLIVPMAYILLDNLEQRWHIWRGHRDA